MRQTNKAIQLFILLFLLFINGRISYAQNLFQVVSVDIQNQRLEDALASISKKGNFYFSYSSNFIPKDSLVSVSAKSHTVKEVLDVLLSEKYEYKEAHNYIILRPAPHRLKLIPEEVSDKNNWYTVTGYVIDDRTGAKVSQASVYEKRLLSSTLTDKRGYFKLKLRKKEDEIALTVSKELYRDFTLVILPSTMVHPGGNNNLGYDPEEDPERVERTAFGRLLISSRQKIQSLNLSGFFTNSPFQASLTPGLSTHGIFNSQVVNKFSLNLAGGYTNGVKGLELAAGFNINKRNVSYLQAAGIFNVVGGSVKGVQLAGFNNTVMDSVVGLEAAGVYNDVRGDLLGVQLAGVVNANKENVSFVQVAGAVNLVGGSVLGVQISGAANIVKDSITGVGIAGAFNDAKGNVSGVQIAGAFNKAGNEVEGGQLSGLFNYSKNRIKGFQISGGINIGNKEVKGLQLTGAGNVSKAEMNGVQVASLFNYAGTLRGVQFGLINIADSSSGVSIGFLNIIRGGYHKISVSTNEIMNTNVAFKTGNAKFYSIISGGLNISDNNKACGLGFGFGHDFILNKKLLISAELSSTSLYLGDWDNINVLNRAKTTLSIELTKGISLYAGPALNAYINNAPATPEGYKTIEPENLTFNYSKKLKGWIGFEAGISIF